MRQSKPTRGCALKGATTAASPNVLAMRSEHGRDMFFREAAKPQKGHTTCSCAWTKLA